MKLKFEDPPAEVEWSEFERLLGISGSSVSQLPDSPSGTREFDKIVMLSSFFEYDCKVECWGYCMDVNSSSSIVQELKPFIRLDVHDVGHHAYAILGSMLYMFGRADDYRSIFGNGFSYYDMMSALISSSSPEKPSLYLRKDDLIDGSPMLARKDFPVAVVIGDSRICVFSMVLCDDCCPSFELLDTGNLTWKSLPQPIPPGKHYRAISIQSYCVHRSCLIIQTNRGHGAFYTDPGIFGINLDSAKPADWVRFDLCGEQGFPFRGMFAKVDQMFFDEFDAWRWGDSFPPYSIKIQPPPVKKIASLIHRESSIPPPLDRALYFDDRCNILCMVEDEFPCLLVHIVKFDDATLEKLGSDLSNWENIHTNKSFTFALPSCHWGGLGLLGCFPIKKDGRKRNKYETDAFRLAPGRRRRKKKKNKTDAFGRHLLRKTILMKKN